MADRKLKKFTFVESGQPGKLPKESAVIREDFPETTGKGDRLTPATSSVRKPGKYRKGGMVGRNYAK